MVPALHWTGGVFSTSDSPLSTANAHLNTDLTVNPPHPEAKTVPSPSDAPIPSLLDDQIPIKMYLIDAEFSPKHNLKYQIFSTIFCLSLSEGKMYDI